MANRSDRTEVVDQSKQQEGTEDTGGHGKSGGHMGAGKSGTEGLGTEKPSDDVRMGSQKSDGGSDEAHLRAHDDKHSARGGGSNQDRDKGGPETDATGGRRAKHNDDPDKYHGRGTGNRGKGS